MSQITGGSVTYERLVKTGDYENKKLAVTLTFTVDDGDDVGVLEDRVTSRAVFLVEKGLKNPTIVAPTAQEIAATAQVAQKELSDKQSVKAPKAKKAVEPKVQTLETAQKQALVEDWPEGQVNGGKDRTLKQQLEASLTDPLKAAEPPARIIDTGKKIEPSTMVFPGDSRAAGNLELVSGAVPASGIDRTAAKEPDWSDPDPTTAPISDQTLVQTANAASARGVDKAKVRHIFAPLLPAGALVQLANIPQAARADFVAAVNAL